MLEIPSGGAMAMAGMLQEQTRQQINGFPGLMQLPVLGALFKSRDYVNRQTELMVLVTPYIVRATAQKNLSRPDDGFADAVRSVDRAARPAQSHLRHRRPRRSEPDLLRQLRLQPRLTVRNMPMSGSRSCIIDRRRFRSAVMGVLAAASAVLLSGCYTVKDTTASIPVDYRQRHPITIKETDHTIEVFVGSNRGGLNASQRADVLAFAQAWKKEATGGIIIDQPIGTSNQLAADEAVREARSILAGCRLAASTPWWCGLISRKIAWPSPPSD